MTKSLTSFDHPRSIFRSCGREGLGPRAVVDFEPGGPRRKFAMEYTAFADAGPEAEYNPMRFDDDFSERDYYLLRLADAQVLGDKMYLAGENGLLRESVSSFDPGAVAALGDAPELVELDAEALVVGNIGYRNYYHWVFQGVSVALDALARDRPLPRLIVPPLNRWRAEHLELLGIDPAECVQADPTRVVHAPSLLYSCFATSAFAFAPHRRLVGLFDEFSRTFEVPADAPRDELVYISRGGSDRRSIANEAEMAELLGARGFAAHRLEDLSVAHQIALFRGARHVVAPHGAGLVNLLYARECRSVTELFPANYVNICFFRLCQVKGVERHHALVSRVVEERGRHHSSSEMDLEALESQLDRLPLQRGEDDGTAVRAA